MKQPSPSSFPTLHHFISVCKRRYRCKVESVRLLGPMGEVDCRCLTRTTGRARVAIIPGLHGDEPLAADVLESLCNRLDVPRERFWPTSSPAEDGAP